MEWTDADGEPLGEWVPCTEPEYLAVLNAIADPVVLSGRTEVGESLSEAGFGEPYRDRHISKEWGERGATHPLARCEDHWDYFGAQDHTHYRLTQTGERT